MVMEAGMLPYDARPVSNAPMARPLMAPQYFAAPSYGAAPMANMPAQPYAAGPMPFDGFPSYSPPPGPGVSPFKHQFPDRMPPRVVSAEPDMTSQTPRAWKREPSMRADGSRSPSVKSEAQMSVAKSITSTHSGPPRTIASIVPVNPANQISFHTEVDCLVKALQAKKETDNIVAKVEAEQMTPVETAPVVEVVVPAAPSQPVGVPDTTPRSQGRHNRKRYECDIADCGKTFFQKTHLDIHKRSHTGDKPYSCKLPGCGSRFSQLGNLKTHERRHTGEKPFQCDQCGKRFAQRGNVRAHLKTHLNTKPYLCRLDDCNKRFTQLGNLKSHQNKFHGKTIKRLTQKFAQLKDYDKASKAERELWEYFATLYKNSNKGIKGRGKDRKVDPGPQAASPLTPKPTIPSHAGVSSMHGSPNHYTYAAPAMPLPPPPQHHGVSHPAAYSMSRPNMAGNVVVGMGHRGGQPEYEMFDVGDAAASNAAAAAAVGSAPNSAVPGSLYDDHAARELAFSDRMYS